MSDFIKEKFITEFQEGMEEECDALKRKYTLTHDDNTGEIFLYTGENYAIDRISENRDDVLASWYKISDTYILNVDLHLDCTSTSKDIDERNIIFRKELPLALKAIIYGDRKLYLSKKELINAPIIVNFKSGNKDYNKIERWGSIKDYIGNESRAPKDEKIFGGVIKDKIIVTLLAPYIEKELKKIYGNKYLFCSNFSEILGITPLTSPFICNGTYIVVVGVKSDVKRPSINNVIIEFVIKSGEVKVKSVKNPR